MVECIIKTFITEDGRRINRDCVQSIEAVAVDDFHTHCRIDYIERVQISTRLFLWLKDGSKTLWRTIWNTNLSPISPQ